MSTYTLKLVAIDETGGWDLPEFKGLYGKIYGVYLFDPGQKVYLCEMTGSRELWPVMTEFTPGPGYEEASDEAKEAFSMAILENQDAEIVYMHASRVDALPPECFLDVEVDEEDLELKPVPEGEDPKRGSITAACMEAQAGECREAHLMPPVLRGV